MTVIINGTSGITFPDSSTQSATGANATNITSGTVNQSYGGTGTSTGFYNFKNRFINGLITIAQRGNSATVTAGNAVPTTSAGYPCVDRWFVYSLGANVTAAQVAGSGNNQNNLQITGGASVTAVGVGQRIEASNSYDLAGQTVTLSVSMSNSLLSNVTWTASYANTSNTFGTIGTPTKVHISTGTFTVNSTFSQYSTQIAIPSNATTGVEVILSVGAQTNGTWVIGRAQLELGSQATSFDFRPYGNELDMCKRYYQKSFPVGTTPFNNAVASSISAGNYAEVGGTGATSGISYKRGRAVLTPEMRTTPGTVTFFQPNGSGATAGRFGDIVNGDANVTYTAAIGVSCSTYFDVTPNGGNGLTSLGNPFGVQWTASAEL